MDMQKMEIDVFYNGELYGHTMRLAFVLATAGTPL